MRWSIALLLTACGRIGFQTVDDAPGVHGDARGDAARDGNTTHDDGPQPACASATPVQVNTRVAATTCSGHDLIDGCSATGLQEVVFSFTAPAAGGYSFRAFDPGTNNVSNTSGRADPTCTMTTNCAGIYSTQMAAGEVMYLVVESATGGCAQIEFEVM